MTSAKDNDLAISHLSAEQKHHFLEQILAEDDLKSFYNAISSGDTMLVDLLVEYRGLKELPQELESLLAESYARLKIQNVPVPRGMEVFVESKLIDLRFFTSKDVEDKKCTKVSLQDVKTRIQLTCLHAEKMRKKGKVIDGEFILLGRFVAQNIHILKRQLKGTYTKLPWEEMEFLLVCFISAVCAPQEADSIYLLVLDQAKLLKYLNNFVIKLQDVEKELKETDVSIKLALGNRSLIIHNILIESPDFRDMYRDHDLVKSVYSLKRIRYYIRQALDVNPNEGMEVMETLVLERTLQVVGESLKNTPDSPNVSEEVHQLLAHRAPRQARELSTALRDCLSHSRSYTRRPEQDSLFRQRLREDLRKMNAEITYILYMKKKDALQIFHNKVINFRDVEELAAVIHNPDKFSDEDLNFSNDFTLEFLHEAKGLFNALKENVVDKTGVTALFDEAEELLRSEETRINDVQKSYTEEARYVIKLIKNFSAGSNISEIKTMAKMCLLNLMSESPPQNFKRFLNVISKICAHFIERKDRDTHQIDNALRINFNVVENIAYRTYAIVEFMAGRIGGIDEFRNKIDGGSDDEVEEHQKVQQIFDDVVNLLERQQDRSTLQTKFERCIELHRAKGELIKHFDSRLRGESTVFNGFASCVEKLCLKHKNFKDLEKFYEEGDYGKCKTGIQIIEDHYGKFTQTVEELSLFSREKYAEACRAFFGTLKLKGKANLSLTSIVDQHIEKRNHSISSYFSSRLPILDRLLSVAIAEPRGSHYVAVEMLALELTEILDNISFFGDGALFLDQFSPVLIGKSLRNYLAHGDLLVDNLLSDPRTAVMHASLLLVRAGGELVSQSGVLIGGNIVADFGKLQQMYDVCLGTVAHQDTMFDAVEKGCVDLVKDCVSDGVDVNGANFEGWTGLHYAAVIGSSQILEFFLELGVNLDVKDIYGKIPVQIACDFGRMNILQYLFEHNYFTSNYVTPDQNTLLHLSARLGQADIVSRLLDKENINFENIFGQTPMHLASEAGHSAIVRILLGEGAIQARSARGETPSMLAVQAGHEDVVRLLLAGGAVAYTKGDGMIQQSEKAGTLLHIAARNGHIEIVKTLLNHVDDSILVDFIRAPARNGSRALHLAAARGHAGVVEELLARGNSVEEENEDGQTALHMAVANGFTTVIKLLLNKGAAINATDIHLRTSLHLAVQREHAEAAQELLDRGSDVRAETDEGYTALHIAAGIGDIETLQILLDCGAQIETKSQNGFTALHLAVKLSRAKTAKCLINHAKKWNQCREFVNSLDENNSTPLHVVAALGDEECARELLGAGAILEARDYTHCTPLHVAAMYGEVAIMHLLIENGCDVNSVTPDNNWSALFFAVHHDHPEAVTLLIEKGIKLDIVTQNNETALLVAVGCGNKEIVHTLLCAIKNFFKEDIYKAFINTPQKDSEQTALHFAVKNGHKEITTLLLDAGANVEAADRDGNTPMMNATVTGNMDIFLALLDKNANINIESKSENAPLFYAASGGHLPVVKKLLALGSDPHQEDALAQTALHWAAAKGHTLVVDFLLNSGLDIEAEQIDGFTALHLAALNGFHDVAELMLRNKANVNKRCPKGWTPLHCASQNGNLKVVKLLLDNGANVARNSTALHLAATNKSIMRALLEAGAEVDALDQHQNSALHLAARKGNREVVSLLIDFGADPELKDAKDQTALFLAIQYGCGSVVKELVGRRVNIDPVGPANISAIHVAASKGFREIVQFLLNNGSNATCMTNSGLTPLHIAALGGFHDLVGIFIMRGANVNAVDCIGWTALHHAAIDGNLMVVEELVKFGALDCETEDGQIALNLAEDGGHEDVVNFLSSCWTPPKREEL